MSVTPRAPQASTLRLSRYHCFVGEILRSDEPSRLTSREIADELGVSEETVRRDLSYIDVEGRPGAGYDPATLYEALETFLGLSDHYPFVAVGDRDMLQALTVIFPAAQFGLEAVGYFSARAEDVDAEVRGVRVHGLATIPTVAPALGATVALVACEPEKVSETLDLLDSAGVHAVLMLTPVLRPRHPAGMDVTYFRIPCAMKALASSAPRAGSGCETPEACDKRTCCHG
jgi:NADH/NAD ratio-sensing transcriptional regulator Rex